MVHTFNGWGSPVLCLEQSTALDVIGIGLATGQVFLHNVCTDESLMSFKQDWGPVTTLSFRTGTYHYQLHCTLVLYIDGVDMLVSASTTGSIAVWDLNEKRLASVLYGAHQSLAAATFFNNEPVMVTNGADNTIKVIIIYIHSISTSMCIRKCDKNWFGAIFWEKAWAIYSTGYFSKIG